MNEKLNKAQNSFQYEKKLQLHSNLITASQPRLIDDDFWKIHEEDNQKDSNIEEMLGKGLWITNLESSKPPIMQSVVSLPKQKPHLASIEKRNTKSKLEIQQERHLRILQDKQPLGRDGKRIPLPKIKKNVKNTTGSSISLGNSNEFRI